VGWHNLRACICGGSITLHLMDDLPQTPDNVGHPRDSAEEMRRSSSGGDGPVGASADSSPALREVSLRALNRHTSDVIGGIRDGERVVITRYGIPVAVLLSVADALELSGAGPGQPVATVIELRGRLREALRTVVGSELERRVWRSEIGRYLHGRHH
jgi:prevent-host-death family protein